jgi:hypothetical protein
MDKCLQDVEDARVVAARIQQDKDLSRACFSAGCLAMQHGDLVVAREKLEESKFLCSEVEDDEFGALVDAKLGELEALERANAMRSLSSASHGAAADVSLRMSNLLASGQASSSEYFALQIGLLYADSPKYRLDGCVKDIENMSDFFRQRRVVFCAHVVCSDKITSIDATHKLGGSRSDILSGMKLIMDAMSQSVAVNKFLFFNFSGHGTQVRDGHGDEEVYRGLFRRGFVS